MLRCTAQREVRRGGLVEEYYGGLAPQKFQRVLLAPPLVLGRLETSTLAAAWSDVLCCVYTRVAADDESEGGLSGLFQMLDALWREGLLQCWADEPSS